MNSKIIRNKITLSLLIAFTTLLPACNCNNKFTIIGDNDIVYGKIKYVRVVDYELVIKFDEFQKGKVSSIIDYLFDEKTNLLRVRGGLSDSVCYTYDLENRLIKKDDFHNGKKESFHYYYKENQLAGEVNYLNDSIVKKITFEYSNSNKKRIAKLVTGNTYKIIISEFDYNNNIISERLYNAAGTRENESLYTYNHKGLLLRSSRTDEYIYNDKNLKINKTDWSGKYNFEYEKFDKCGNWLNQEYYVNYGSEGYRHLVERKIQYYE